MSGAEIASSLVVGMAFAKWAKTPIVAVPTVLQLLCVKVTTTVTTVYTAMALNPATLVLVLVRPWGIHAQDSLVQFARKNFARALRVSPMEPSIRHAHMMDSNVVVVCATQSIQNARRLRPDFKYNKTQNVVQGSPNTVWALKKKDNR